MILCEWDASEGHPGQSCVHLYARILSTSFISVSIFSVWCYSSVLYLNGSPTEQTSDEEMERGLSEWRRINVLYECDCMNVCTYVIKYEK
jgi:hypothetical protein